jgi:rSAM/selenodomain-associated transferase 2/rSAM/selenodomain-associated transferase 1
MTRAELAVTDDDYTPPAGIRISVVIPALNEEQSIGSVLAAIPKWVSQIVVADNGSTDSTAAIARRFGATVVHEPQRGYGAACLAGLAILDRPHIVVFLDGDFSDHPREMSRLIAPIVREEADLVIGSRVLGHSEEGALTPQQRFGNALACWLIRLFYGVRHTDLGPFRAIRYTSLQRLSMDDRDYGWTVQMQVRAARLGLRAVEMPVSYRCRIGKSKISGTIRGVIGAGIKILSTIFREAVRGQSDHSIIGTDRLIIFGRYPKPGQAKTRLIPLLGPTGAALLHRQLVRITVEASRQLRSRRNVVLELRFTGSSRRELVSLFGRDLIYCKQGPGNLGQRLRAAAAEAINSGAGKVVLIGTDCPMLDADRLDLAFVALDDHDVVIGPALDGGYYLIGIKSDHAELFEDIAWGGPEVLAQTLNACHRLGLRHILLPVLSDVDTPADLVSWASARLAMNDTRPRISVIIPTRNEQDHLAATICSTLTAGDIQIIVVDARSTDLTREIARHFGVTVVDSEPSRGRQLNLGASHARGDRLIFLHADTILPFGFASIVEQTLGRPGIAAGAFNLSIDARGLAPRLIEWGVFVRARILGRPYGDQALFMTSHTYRQCGGFPDLPYMEDYVMLSRVKVCGRIHVASASVSTSARRWESRGWIRTTLWHQWLILRYHLTGGSNHSGFSESPNGTGAKGLRC